MHKAGDRLRYLSEFKGKARSANQLEGDYHCLLSSILTDFTLRLKTIAPDKVEVIRMIQFEAVYYEYISKVHRSTAV